MKNGQCCLQTVLQEFFSDDNWDRSFKFVQTPCNYALDVGLTGG